MFGKHQLIANPTEDVTNHDPKDCIVVVSNHSKAADKVTLEKFWGYIEKKEVNIWAILTFSKEFHVPGAENDLFELVEQTNQAFKTTGINPRHWTSIALFADQNPKPIDEVFEDWIQEQYPESHDEDEITSIQISIVSE